MIVGKVVGGVVGALVTIRYGLGLSRGRQRAAGATEVQRGRKIARGHRSKIVRSVRRRRGDDEGDADETIDGPRFWSMRRLHLWREEPRPRRFLEEDVPEHEHDSPSAHGDVPTCYEVSFVMSTNETVRTLPVPTDSSMALRQIKPHTAAFVRFSGPPPSEQRVAKERARLEAALAKHGGARSSGPRRR